MGGLPFLFLYSWSTFLLCCACAGKISFSQVGHCICKGLTLSKIASNIHLANRFPGRKVDILWWFVDAGAAALLKPLKLQPPFPAAFYSPVTLHGSLHREVALKLLEGREVVSSGVAEPVAGSCKPFYQRGQQHVGNLFCLHEGVKKVRGDRV